MKINVINAPEAGTWSKDCKLLHFSLSDRTGIQRIYHRTEDNTYWKLNFVELIGYKMIVQEFSTVGYLKELPVRGAFYEILDSPWIENFEVWEYDDIAKWKHYVLQFCDQTIEVLAQGFSSEQLKEKPVFNI